MVIVYILKRERPGYISQIEHESKATRVISEKSMYLNNSGYFKMMGTNVPVKIWAHFGKDCLDHDFTIVRYCLKILTTQWHLAGDLAALHPTVGYLISLLGSGSSFQVTASTDPGPAVMASLTGPLPLTWEVWTVFLDLALVSALICSWAHSSI